MVSGGQDLGVRGNAEGTAVGGNEAGHGGAVPVTVFEHSATPTDYGQWTRDLDVNSANDLLYVGRRTDTLDGLVRVDLDPDLTDTAGNQEVTVLFNSLNGNTIIVGADVSSPASDSIAFQAYSTELNCSLLTVMNGRTGTVLNEGAAWPGTNVSWSGGKMLALGYVPVRNRSLGCRSTDVIEEIDPVTGATVPLVIGIVPDGR